MKALSIFTLVLFFLTTLLFADPRGIYLGGALGQSFIKTDVKDLENSDLKLDDSDFAYKFIVGVRMTEGLAIEGGYKFLGNVKDKKDDIVFESKTTGYDLCAVGNVYLGLFDIFGKAGAFWWDQETKFNNQKITDDNTSFMWGFGATFHLKNIGIRAEWERFELKDFDRLSMLSLGVVFSN